MNLSTCSFIGFSSGGPYALACAIRLYSRVRGLALVSSDGEYANADVGVPVGSPMIYGGISRDDIVINSRELAKMNAVHLLDSYSGMKNELRKKVAIADLQEAVRNGYQGVARDSVLETQRWDFDIPATLEFSTHIFHGTKDESVPFKVAEWLHRVLPNSELHLAQDENHSMIRRRFEDVLSKLTLTNNKHDQHSL